MASGALAEDIDILNIGIEELQNITVSVATKESMELSNVPATVRVVSAKEIGERGYKSLEDILKDLPGFNFRDINGFNSYSFMRGAVSQNNLILLMIDGVAINELNSGGFYGGLQYNLQNIKQVEVLYGPSSTLYGTNAMSGIINIVTLSPKDYASSKGLLSVGAGTHGAKSVFARSGSYDTKTRFGYSAALGYSSTDKMDLGGSAGDYNWRESFENFEKDLSFEGKIVYGDFETGMVFQDKRTSRSTNDRSFEGTKRDFDTLWHITFLNLWAKHEAKLTDKAKLRSKLYYRNATIEDDTVAYIDTLPTPGTQVGYYRPNHLMGIDESLIYSPKKELTLTIGFTGESEKLAREISTTNSASADTKPTSPSAPPMDTNTLFSPYAQLQYELTKGVFATLGIRHDKSSYYDDVTTPRAALVYSNGDFGAKLIYQEAFRAPKPWDYNYGVGNNALSPEKMKSLELALSYKFTPSFFADIAIYRNYIDNKLTQSLTPIKWVNSGALETNGFEASMKYQKESLSLYANYSYTDSFDENGKRSDEIAMHALNAGANYRFSANLRADIRTNYVSDKTNPILIETTNSYKIEPYWSFATRVSYLDFYGANLHLDVTNIFDKEYYHTSSRSVTRYRQMERGVMITLEKSFTN